MASWRVSHWACGAGAVRVLADVDHFHALCAQPIVEVDELIERDVPRMVPVEHVKGAALAPVAEIAKFAPQQQPAIIMLTGQSFLPGIHEAMRVTLTRWPAM